MLLMLTDTSRITQLICFIYVFPGKPFRLATKVPVGGGFTVFNFVCIKQIKHGQNSVGTQIKMFTNQRGNFFIINLTGCLLYTSPSPRDRQKSRMPSSA